jgi:hypothetical protein
MRTASMRAFDGSTQTDYYEVYFAEDRDRHVFSLASKGREGNVGLGVVEPVRSLHGSSQMLV